MTHRPFFIAVEGADGAGKTTAIKTIQSKLQAAEIPALTTFEPGDTSLGKEVRKILLSDEINKEGLSPTAQTLMFLADRDQHLRKAIIPALRSGITIVTDRYLDSTQIYQGNLGGQTWLLKGLYNVPSLSHIAIRPDVTIYLLVDKATGRARCQARGKNILDDLHDGHYVDVYQAWDTLAKTHQKVYGNQAIKLVNASEHEDSVESQLNIVMDEIILQMQMAVDKNYSTFAEFTRDMQL